MDLRDYLNILRTNWLAVLLLAAFGTLVAFGWTLVQPRVYTADATGFISTGSLTTLADASVGDSFARNRAASYVDIATSRAVADYAITELRLHTTPEELARQITVTNPVGSVVIRISADAGTPQDASALANTWLRGLVAQVSALENADPDADAGTVGSIVQLVPVDSAVVPTSPSSPNVALALTLGALIGLAAGIGYALIRHTLDRRARDAEGVERETGLPVIGTIPANKRMSGGDRLSATAFGAQPGADDGEHAITEAFRQLRTNLRYMNVDDPPRVILVTSPLPGDGKSTVAANLAVAMAAAGHTVFLIDGDLRRPTVAQSFGLPEGAGLTDVLIGSASLEDVVHTVGADRRLHVIASGNIPPNPTELLGSQTMHRLLEGLSREATVLIDAPPLLAVTDGAVLAAITDGALVVASTGKATYDQLRKAVAHLERVNSRPLGIILNRVSPRGPDRSEYYRYEYRAATGHGAAR